MNKKVSITELMTETAVLTIGLTFYYWCWVRTDWKESYTYIQNAVAGGIICFIFLISYRVRKFHKEPIDELACKLRYKPDGFAKQNGRGAERADTLTL